LSKPLHIRVYALFDVLAAVLAWQLYQYLHPLPIASATAQILFTATAAVFWLIIYHLFGTYKNIYYKSRLEELILTGGCAFVGCLVLYFLVIPGLLQSSNKLAFKGFLLFFVVQLTVTYVFRFLFLTKAHKQLQEEKVWFNTLIIGSNNTASKLSDAIKYNKEKTGFRLCGMVHVGSAGATNGSIGTIDNLSELIDEHGIQEVIIATEKQERHLLERILQQLSEKEVNIKVIPDRVDILTGAVRTANVLGVPLIDLHTGLMASWQQNIKRLIDVLFALTALVVLSPIMLFAALRVRLSSAGPVLYLQERIGYRGRPFMIYKFRSMILQAEQNGPQLSSDNDSRITKWGRIMRRWRLDELPQLFNIIKGEMSLVGQDLSENTI
jgi:polysaccharide biosynthesis protein PslA